MLRLTESYCIDIEFHCKPLGDTDWNGSGMHANFSTKYMREVGGKDYFEKLMAAFDKNLMDHIAVYGPDNDKRRHRQARDRAWNKFSYGLADRGARSGCCTRSSRTATRATEDCCSGAPGARRPLPDRFADFEDHLRGPHRSQVGRGLRRYSRPRGGVLPVVR